MKCTKKKLLSCIETHTNCVTLLSDSNNEMNDTEVFEDEEDDLMADVVAHKLL